MAKRRLWVEYEPFGDWAYLRAPNGMFAVEISRWDCEFQSAFRRRVAAIRRALEASGEIEPREVK